LEFACGVVYLMTVEEKHDVLLDRALEEVWLQTLKILATTLKQTRFDAFIKPAQLVELDADSAVVAVSNPWARDTLHESHITDIESAISQAVGRGVTVRIIVDSSIKPTEYTPSIASITVSPVDPVKVTAQQPMHRGSIASQLDNEARRANSNLNQRYSFHSFVVGSHNRFCNSAALHVAEHPGDSYNPLFLYGGVGLGKTHVMHAVGNYILLHHQNKVVRYITCEQFTNDVINSIRENRMIEFRRRYRQVDVLLIDDIQFIEGKESTQEEFFHTFNTLRDSGRQIVISSDRAPAKLSRLEERMRSRFEWGMVADMQPPDYETRLAILRTKAETDKLTVPDDVLMFIADSFTNNVRELEGALLRVTAFATMLGAPLTAQNVGEILLPERAKTAKPALSIERVIDVVAQYFKMEPSDLKGPSRSSDLTTPRHIAMYLGHSILKLSYPRIGQAFGDRAHTSIMHACNKVKKQIDTDRHLSESIRQIRRELGV
jgi:chromosomal replication initiator protein